MANSLDLTTLLPAQYRDKTIDSLIKNLFNRQISKVDTIPLYGFVGDQVNLRPGEIQITESNLERQINQLAPFIYSEHASENLSISWSDIVQKLVTLGVDYSSFQDWFTTKSYNFAPPIDLDKFCNFQEYFWVGKWFLTAPNYDYTSLGIATPSTYHIPAFNNWGNTTFDPEYYVIARGPQVAGVPTSPQPTFPGSTWSDWSYSNLWVHRDDVIQYINATGGLVNFSTIIQATRPIIEYSCYLGLNTARNIDGSPTDSVTDNTLPAKTFNNQLPLFNLYKYDGSHTGTASSIFYYIEGPEFPIDPVIGRRLAISSNKDFIFGHALVNTTDQSLNFYKLYDPIV